MYESISHAATTMPDYIPSPRAPWAVHRGDAQNTGRFPGNLRRTARVGRRPWRFDTGGIVWATPLIGHDGELYVGSASKRFYCINADGTERWRFELPDAPEALIDGTAALLRDLVVVPAGDGVLYALERATGRCRWRFRAYHAAHHASGRVVDSLEAGVGLGPKGRLFVGSDNGHLYCLTDEGAEVWSFRTNMMLWSTPAFAPNGLWLALGSLDRRLYLLDVRTGEKIASAKLAGELKGSPAIGPNGDVYVGCSDGSIRCYRLVDNGWTRHLEQRWQHNTQGEVYASPALADGFCVAGSHDGHVYCLDQLTGARRWRHDLRSRVSASAVISKDGLVIVGARSGSLHVLSLGDGRSMGSFRTAAGRHVNLDASPSVDAIGRIFVGSYDGGVYCIPAEFPLLGSDETSLSHGSGPAREATPSALVPQDGVVLCADGCEDRDAAALPVVARHAPHHLRLVVHENGKHQSRARLSPVDLEVEVTPQADFDMVLASDNSAINLVPRPTWRADTTYRVDVRGRYHIRTGPITGRLVALGGKPFRYTAAFCTASSNSVPVKSGTLQFAIRRLRTYQPDILDIFVAAALEAQAFVLTVPTVASGPIAGVAFAGYPRPDGTVVLRKDPERVIALAGELIGETLVLQGNAEISAMGASFAYRPLRVSGRLTRDGIADGLWYGTVPIWRVRGNGGLAYGISWRAFDQLTDAWMQAHVFGSLEGHTRTARSVSDVEATGIVATKTGTEVTVHSNNPDGADHLLTVLWWDRRAGNASQQSRVVRPEHPGSHQFDLAIRALSGENARAVVLWDGVPLPVDVRRGDR